MRLITLIVVAAMPFQISSAVAAQISNDTGGRIGTYVEKFNRLRDSGEQVAVDGQCLSACTLLLAIVPRDHICITPNATFGFHAAWSPNSTGDTAINPAATRLLWNMYPSRIRNWIRKNGGLGQSMIYLRGQQLAEFYPACAPDSERGAFAAVTHPAKTQAASARDAARSLARARPNLGHGRSSAIAESGSRVAPRD